MKHTAILTLLLALTAIAACKHEAANEVTPTTNVTAITDAALFAESSTTNGFTYYKNNNTILPTSGPSAHNAFFRVRFNAIAFAALTDNGKLPVGGTFPEGSLIVKELHNNASGTAETGIAIMKKNTGDPNANENGWVWAEYFGDANTGLKVNTKGTGCNGCHSGPDNRDKVRLFHLFP